MELSIGADVLAPDGRATVTGWGVACDDGGRMIEVEYGDGATTLAYAPQHLIPVQKRLAELRRRFDAAPPGTATAVDIAEEIAELGGDRPYTGEAM